MQMTWTKSFATVVVLTVLFAVLAASIAPSASSRALALSADWTERGPILINGDSRFTSENGIVSGSGTKSDPYIIEGWRIGPFPNSTAITTLNTNAYFKIRNVYTFSCSIGVFMNGVHNGWVEDSQFINDTVGVAFYKSDNCKVASCTIEGSDTAISTFYSGVSQSGNTFINNYVNVVSKKDEQRPWEFTWVGTVVWAAFFTFFAAIIAILIYNRVRRSPPPV